MFNHWKIKEPSIDKQWTSLKRTISGDVAYKATEIIGEYAAVDMIESTGIGKGSVDRVYVKFRDGIPMAAGIRKALPNIDIRYIVSREKQQGLASSVPISFWDPWDGYSSDIAWFADPMNSTGNTAIKSMRFLYKHFAFDTILFSHIAANMVGIGNIQTKITDFNIDSYMNYAYLSKKLDPNTGYMLDGLELIPDHGDKVFRTLGEDYPIWQIRDGVRRLLGTGVGDVEIVRGAILHLLQLRSRDEYKGDRNASWATENWIAVTLAWYRDLRLLPLKVDKEEQIIRLLDDLKERGFLEIEKRPWRRGYAKIYFLTQEGLNYTSSIYLPILAENGMAKKLQKDFDFLVHLEWKRIYGLVREAQIAG